MNNREPEFNDYINWIEALVLKYGVEIDIFAWGEIKKHLINSQQKDINYE